MSFHSRRPIVHFHALAEMRAAPLRWSQHLIDAEVEEASRFLRADDRDRFILGRGALREAVGRILNRLPKSLDIRRDKHGKPRLVDAHGIHANVSHSGSLVAVALGTQAQLGVDVEMHRQDCAERSSARYFMSRNEQAAMVSLPEKQRIEYFFRQWCSKEALVKALGTGLLLDPTRFEITFDEHGPRLRFVGSMEDDVGSGWSIESLPVPAGYSAALAWRNEI
ncbi:Sfp Phosphopantetheinyl transferase [Rhabdaerophilaceae bacterium]